MWDTYEAGCHAHGELMGVLRNEVLAWMSVIAGPNGRQMTIAGCF